MNQPLLKKKSTNKKYMIEWYWHPTTLFNKTPKHVSKASFFFPAQILPKHFWVSLANTQCNPIHRYGLSIVIERVRSSSLPKLQTCRWHRGTVFKKEKRRQFTRWLKTPKRCREIYIYILGSKKRLSPMWGFAFPFWANMHKDPTLPTIA